jgi:hypothetical protein
MPFFVSNILEIPVTMVQDYQLFHILGEYSIDLWRQQLQIIMRQHGVATFIVHPDYIQEKRARSTYTDLLAHIAELRSGHNAWVALPKQVNRWWRDRSRMTLVEANGSWTIEGSGSEHATVAWAIVDQGKLQYVLERGRGVQAQDSVVSLPSQSSLA